MKLYLLRGGVTKNKHKIVQLEVCNIFAYIGATPQFPKYPKKSWIPERASDRISEMQALLNFAFGISAISSASA